MASLIALLGAGKGSWGHVSRVIASAEWERVLLISNEWGKEKFNPPKDVDWIMVNNRAPFDVLVKELKEQLPKGEICVNLASGAGKEHMALIVALQESGKPFKIVTLTAGETK
ncbi:MAG: hypothetical protein ABIE23_05190, partial [archaeon]